RSIIDTERMVASGLAIPCPAISGAEPGQGSYMPWLLASSEADGSMPMEPVSMEASSERMSPNMLSVTITSNCLGARTSCLAALSTYLWLSSTCGYSLATSSPPARHSWLEASTLALSAEQTFL